MLTHSLLQQHLTINNIACGDGVVIRYFGVLHIDNKKREAEIVNTIARNQIVKGECNMAQNVITYNCKHMSINEVDVFT